ncbi:hypothetical protein [uncultured Pseudodesulfovibrio sp.]|uniref:hypothetical protein n=1 Tax=uncultured Pseudodesulfovibrio sp. TaxID=2035858 RepID=UPI0029C911BD|nr:hypothetical protein [uncultured Pseudodesulfovibrio sp.]
MANMTRRQLFRGSFKAGRHVAAVAAGEREPRPPERAPLDRADLEAIAGDFPPELLSMEAERLGLDPDSPDRDALLTAVYEAMAGSGPEKTGE